MMMRMLEAGGVPCFHDSDQRANQFNPGGFYESQAVMGGDFSGVPDGHAVKCLHMLATMPDDLDVKVIIMRRDIAVTMTSANRMAAAAGKPLLPDDYAGFLQGCMDAIRLWCAGKPHVEVRKDDVHRNTANECLRVRRMLGIDLDLAAMANVPSPRSYLCRR
jgi:hypothetical protein